MSASPIRRTSCDLESGYNSADSSQSSLSDIFFSKPHLKHINAMLAKLPAEDILKWCIISLPGLYQESALGLTGLVTRDMISKLDGPIKPKIDLIFLDTLHHFKETLDLVDRVRERYPESKIHVYKPNGVSTAEEFTATYGERLWEQSEELYDWTAKVEPADRAIKELNVRAVLTGRRKAQGGSRKNIDFIEVDEHGTIKVNPLAGWTFEQVNDYIKKNNVPYNPLLDQGYKSVGDWHSTQPVAAGEDERAGRWKGRAKTECGIHNPKSRYAQFLLDMQAKEDAADAARGIQLNSTPEATATMSLPVEQQTLVDGFAIQTSAAAEVNTSSCCASLDGMMTSVRFSLTVYRLLVLFCTAFSDDTVIL